MILRLTLALSRKQSCSLIKNFSMVSILDLGSHLGDSSLHDIRALDEFKVIVNNIPTIGLSY